eukprot:TRINITY_DN4394_c0_g1_i1.p1 TRINITY_DN4394_c0_g1~~TRINITY_DN4394_c0_g1_i1.p1  ORF type:complete len:680 (+),score=241.95 TRINITY_DN4394_c0_g1_i1:93-2042(+)
MPLPAAAPGEACSQYCRCIGIDLGTTNSVVAVWDGKQASVVRSYKHGSHTMIPSFVAFEKDTGDRLVGWPAYAQWERNAKNTIFSAKRLIGREFDDPAVRSELKRYPFSVVDYNGKCGIVVQQEGTNRVQTPEQIGAAILSELKAMAQDLLRCDITEAVITVPAYFNDAQREATRAAGRISGLNVRGIINEPTAAALAYGLLSDVKQEKNICIFDLGGGTFDVTVMQVKSNGDFVVKATGGDSHLGGDDFDHRLMDHFLKEWSDKGEQCDPSPNDKQRLLKACKEIKESLSDHASQTLELDGFCGADSFELRISRSRFESLCKDLFKKALDTLESVLRDAGVQKDQIDDVVLVGGSCKMNKVQKMIHDFFGKEPYRNINPDEVVAAGAAVRAASLDQGAPHEGEEGEGMEAVELSGAGGPVAPPSIGKVTDVIPLSLGVGLARDQLSIILPRNTPIPYDKPLSRTMTYRTVMDNQTLSRWVVYQGENEQASKNFRLGQIAITGLPPKPKGQVSVAVTFSFDPADGILNCSAVVLGHPELRTQTTIEKPCTISEDDVRRMEKTEQEFERRRQERRLRDDALAELQELANTILENEDGAFDDPEIQAAAQEVFDWCESNDWAQLAVIQMQKDQLLNKVYGESAMAADDAPS